jgi:hypothetical protein
VVFLFEKYKAGLFQVVYYFVVTFLVEDHFFELFLVGLLFAVMFLVEWLQVKYFLLKKYPGLMKVSILVRVYQRHS